MARDGWTEDAALDVFRRYSPTQAALPLGRPAVRNQSGTRQNAPESTDTKNTTPQAVSGTLRNTPEHSRLQPNADGWYELTIPGEPQVWERAGARIITPKGKRPFISFYTPAATKHHEEMIAALWTAAKGPLLGPLVELDVWVWQTTFKNGNRRGGDWDNFGKLASDALNKLAYEDDKRIIDAHVHKRIDNYAPRLAIRLRTVHDDH